MFQRDKSRLWIGVLLAGSLMAALVASTPAQRTGSVKKKPAEPGEIASARAQAEALNRFRKLTPADRLKAAESAPEAAKLFAPVTRADLTVLVVERGSVASAVVSDVVCKVKSEQANKLTIKWVIEEGTSVKKGDKLLLLDDSALRDQVTEFAAAQAKAKATRVAAETNLELARKKTLLAIRTAELDLSKAKRDLKKTADANAEEKETLQKKVEQATLALEVAQLRGKTKEASAQAALKEKTTAEERASARKRDAEEQIENCVLRATQDGTVVYYQSESPNRFAAMPLVAQGEPVREGQKLLQVCSLERFVLHTKIHEARISAVRVGHTATVRVDAFPGQIIKARVKEVARVASRSDWFAADVKVYPVVLELLAAPKGLKPGMSAEARVELDRREKALQVPLEAVLSSGRQLLCFVKVGKELQERSITLGSRNDQRVEIKTGLKEGEMVLVSPLTVLKSLPH